MGSGGNLVTTAPPVCSRCLFNWAEVLLMCIGGRPSEKVTVVCTCRASNQKDIAHQAAATVTLASTQEAPSTRLPDQ